MVFKKLFPKKKKTKVKTVAQLKTSIHHLNLRTKKFNRMSKEARLRSMKALKAGNKQIARQMLIRWKIYRGKTTRAFSLVSRLQRHMDALEEAKTIKEVTSALESSTSELEKISVDVNPEKSMELIENAEGSIAEIDEAGDLLAGDMEIDLGIDVDEELAQMESEMLLADASGIPSVPDDDLEGMEDFDGILTDDEEGTPIRSKDKIKEEISKLKKELDI
ncbi:MAG: Snf7 family protein [Promethearchaeota archaeon]